MTVTSTGAHAQQSWAMKCSALPANPPAGMGEFCQGIAALSGGDNNNSQPDPAAVVQHYRRAAELGFGEAQAALGAMYEVGWQSVVPRDIGEAVQWEMKAAAQGNARGEYFLGSLYSKGEGVPKDLAKARQLLQAAADQGLQPAKAALDALNGNAPPPAPGADIFRQAVARYNAGDHAGAAVLVRQAAETGNPTATYEMGYLYENGDGVPKDAAQSAQWYMKGAEMGDAASEAAVGQMYEEGIQVVENWDAAAQWYMKSAQQGSRMGEFRLGRAYQYGVGIPLDLNAAEQWYDRAAAQGDSQSAFFAKYIRDNHGFDTSWYSAEEKAIMAPFQMQPWMLRTPPTGWVFHNVTQRLAYYQVWARQAAAYEACVTAHTNAPAGTSFSCPAPVPPR